MSANAEVEFTAVAAGRDITVQMRVRLADLDQYPAPAGRYNTIVASVPLGLGLYASPPEVGQTHTDALARHGWTVDPFLGWTNGVAIVTPTPAP